MREMTTREKLYYLLLHYQTGAYSTAAFSDLFTETVAHFLAPEDCSAEEYRVFCALERYTCRFSPFPEDHAQCPGAFYTEAEIKEQTRLAIGALGEDTVKAVVKNAVEKLHLSI